MTESRGNKESKRDEIKGRKENAGWKIIIMTTTVMTIGANSDNDNDMMTYREFHQRQSAG